MNNLQAIPPGQNIPQDINVVIEIPAQTGPVKYEMNKDLGVICVDRFLSTPMYYPCNYGFMPGTLSEDGDPVDVLVLTPAPLVCGALIRCRPIGMLEMEDEHGIDAKILALPIEKLTPLYNSINTYADLPPEFLANIRHFFEHYKDLENGKWVKVKGWKDIDAAKNEIISSVERYKQKKA